MWGVAGSFGTSQLPVLAIKREIIHPLLNARTMENKCHECDGLAVVCMDWRLHSSGELLPKLSQVVGVENLDVVSLAGAAKNVLSDVTEALLWEHVEFCENLHHGKMVVFTNHSTCGAYGEEGTEEKLKEDLREAGEMVKERFPEIEVRLVFVDLIEREGEWEVECEEID